MCKTKSQLAMLICKDFKASGEAQDLAVIRAKSVLPVAVAVVIAMDLKGAVVKWTLRVCQN